MRRKGCAVTSTLIITIGIICVAICSWQAVFFTSNRSAFDADHPSYVLHSWILLTLLLVPTVLACGQVVLSRRKTSPMLFGAMSALMIVLEVLALRFAADQHYHMGMLISDYGIQAPFTGGWLLLLLVVVLIVATIAQLLTFLFTALSKSPGM